MKRRALLVASTAMVPALAGCLETLHDERDESSKQSGELTTVDQTPDDLTAKYEQFVYEEDADAPLEDDDKIVLTNETAIDETFEDHEDVENVVNAVDFDNSFVLVAQNRTSDMATNEMVVDAVRRNGNELRVNVHCDRESDYETVFRYELVIVVIDGKTEHPKTIDVRFFEPVVCDAEYAPYHRLPEPVKNEVDTALAENQYETEKTLLYRLAVPDDATLWKDNTFYDSQNRDENETTVLTFDQSDGESRDEPASVYFYNRRTDPVDIEVTVTDEGGDRFVDESLSVEPATDEEQEQIEYGTFDDLESSIELTAEYGEYELAVETTDGKTFTESFSINPDHGDRIVGITDEDGWWDGEMIELHSERDRARMLDRSAPESAGVCERDGGWW